MSRRQRIGPAAGASAARPQVGLESGIGKLDGGRRGHRCRERGLAASGKYNAHFSPGGCVIMAQEFSPQRVLASEERSGDYVRRGSMCALKGMERNKPDLRAPTSAVLVP